MFHEVKCNRWSSTSSGPGFPHIHSPIAAPGQCSPSRGNTTTFHSRHWPAPGSRPYLALTAWSHGSKRRLSKGLTCILRSVSSCPEPLSPPLTSVSEVSTSTKKGCSGSGWCKTGAMVNACLSYLKALSAASRHASFLALAFSSTVRGATTMLNLLKKCR